MGVSSIPSLSHSASVANPYSTHSFVISAFVPLVLLWIFGENHLRIVWRGSLALGCIPALLVFLWRLRMQEPERFAKESMKHVTWKQFPVWLIVKRYWFRLAAISLTWFIYDCECRSRGEGRKEMG